MTGSHRIGVVCLAVLLGGVGAAHQALVEVK